MTPQRATPEDAKKAASIVNLKFHPNGTWVEVQTDAQKVSYAEWEALGRPDEMEVVIPEMATASEASISEAQPQALAETEVRVSLFGPHTVEINGHLSEMMPMMFENVELKGEKLVLPNPPYFPSFKARMRVSKKGFTIDVLSRPPEEDKRVE